MKKLSERKKKWIEKTVAEDRSYKRFLYNRFYLYILLEFLQVLGWAFVWWLFAYQSQAGIITQLVVRILSLVTVLYLLNKYERPSVKINWIIIVLIAPVFGVPLYLMYGEGRPTKRMSKKLAKSKAENDKIVKELYGKRLTPKLLTRGDAVSCSLVKISGYPVFYDGEIEYYPTGEKAFPAMLDELKKAEKFILLEYFIIDHGKMWGEILKILLEKAEQGVQIRILYDNFGCMMTLPPKYNRYLESLNKNIRCLTFNKVVPMFSVRMNNRDHKKILVIDGKTAFTGGVNLADEYIGEKIRFGHWKDSVIKIVGNAVNSFTEMFFYMWNAFYKDKENLLEYLLPMTEGKSAETTALRIHPYDDSPFDGVSIGEAVYLDMINRAHRYVYIFTPYLILDDSMRAALCRAAIRGVDVRIVTPAIPDKRTVYRLTRANYPVLMKAGVKIYEYTPGFIHSKSLVCDDESAVVGTINFDYRSLYLHFENAVYFSGCNAVLEVKRDCEETFLVSKQCTLENTKRNLLGRLTDSVLRVFETLL
ncbi:MAG: cardiolipin synthase [Clostridia bacterium]|nr:cardiolipin synthase [Clostridia bacterium]